MRSKLIALWNTKIKQPILASSMSPHEVALGAAVGMFFGLTPTVGLQMVLVWIACAVYFVFTRKRFDILVGSAMVWISNPLTMGFLYYGFYITGVFLISFFQDGSYSIGFEVFVADLNTITTNADLSFWDKAVLGGQYLLVDLGYPMLVGCLFYAIPGSIATYMFVFKLLSQRKQRQKLQG